MQHCFENLTESVSYIKSKTNGFTPEILLALGSGLGNFADNVESPVVLPYCDIPHFKCSSAPGHKGNFVFGRLFGKNVAVMQGRLHVYEGHSSADTVYPVRVARLLGADKMIVTNAAGGVNTAFSLGDIMLITDHIKLFDVNPLTGPNITQLGVRFPDMSAAYTPEYIEICKNAAKNIGITLKTGIYFYFPGPQYETPAEVRAARLLGGDAVGMSTVPEVIAARHCRMKILGISVITNMASGILPKPLDEQEVILAANNASSKMTALLKEVIPLLA